MTQPTHTYAEDYRHAKIGRVSACVEESITLTFVNPPPAGGSSKCLPTGAGICSGYVNAFLSAAERGADAAIIWHEGPGHGIADWPHERET